MTQSDITISTMLQQTEKWKQYAVSLHATCILNSDKQCSTSVVAIRLLRGICKDDIDEEIRITTTHRAHSIPQKLSSIDSSCSSNRRKMLSQRRAQTSCSVTPDSRMVSTSSRTICSVNSKHDNRDQFGQGLIGTD